MKRIFLMVLLALFSLVGFAQITTINFDAMRMSEDGGKTWSDRMSIEGSFVIDDGQQKKVSLILGDDTQSYNIISSIEQDGKTIVECVGSDKDQITLTFAPKTKEVTFAAKDGMSNFRVTKVEKK